MLTRPSHAIEKVRQLDTPAQTNEPIAAIFSWPKYRVIALQCCKGPPYVTDVQIWNICPDEYDRTYW